MLLVAGLMAQLALPGCAAESRVLVRVREKVLKDAKEEDTGLSSAGSSPLKKFATEVEKKLKNMKGDTSFLKAFPGKSINMFTNFREPETVQFRFMLARTGSWVTVGGEPGDCLELHRV